MELIKVDEHLSFGSWPNSTLDIQRLKNAGFKNVISLVPLEKEVAAEVKKQGLTHQISFYNPKSDLTYYFSGVMSILSRTRGKTFVHCLAGVSYSPLVATCYLVSHGTPLKEAMARIKSLRSAFETNRDERTFLRLFGKKAKLHRSRSSHSEVREKKPLIRKPRRRR